MKKILFVFVVFCGATMLFAGGASEPETDGPITIRFQEWLSSSETSGNALRHMIARFEEENPGIRVELVSVPFDDTQQQSLLAASARNAPDVLQLNPTFASPLIDMGALVDLTEFFEQGQLDQIPAGALDSGLRSGQLFTLPWQLGPITVFGNVGLMERAGIGREIPDNVEDFKDAIRRISELDQGVYGFGLRSALSANTGFWFAPWIWMHGGELFDDDGSPAVDAAATVEALEWLREMQEDGLAPVAMESIAEGRALFTQGRIGFVFEGPWMRGLVRDISGLGEEADSLYVVGEMPASPDGIRRTIANDHVLAVSRDSRHPELAARLIEFLTANQEIANFYFETMASIPPFESILSDPLFADDDYVQVFVSSAEYSQALLSPHPRLSEALTALASSMQDVILGGDPRAVATDVSSEFERLLTD